MSDVTIPPRQGHDLATLLAQATFLLDRLSEFEASFDGTPDEIYREFSGHVTPAMARLKSTLQAIRSSHD